MCQVEYFDKLFLSDPASTTKISVYSPSFSIRCSTKASVSLGKFLFNMIVAVFLGLLLRGLLGVLSLGLLQFLGLLGLLA